jgi:hypothetical protein
MACDLDFPAVGTVPEVEGQQYSIADFNAISLSYGFDTASSMVIGVALPLEAGRRAV